MTKARPSREWLLAAIRSGYTNRELADAIGVTTRTLERDRQRDPDLDAAIKAIRVELERAALQPCGTLAAYRRHLRRREEPDAACRRANADAVALRELSTRAKADRVASLTVRIEQAIASGHSTSWIMNALGVDYVTVQTVRAAMSDGIAS